MESLLRELKVIRQEITVIPSDFNGRYNEEAETAFRWLFKKADVLLARLEPIVSGSLDIHKRACQELEDAHKEISLLKEKLDVRTLEQERAFSKRENELVDKEMAVSYRLASAEAREAAAVQRINETSATAISLGSDYKKRVDEFEADYKQRCETVNGFLNSELKRLSAKERGLEAQYLAQTKAALSNLRSEYDTLFANLEQAVVAKLNSREQSVARREQEAAELKEELVGYRDRIHKQYQERTDQLAREFSRKRKVEEHELEQLQAKYNTKFTEIDAERKRLAKVAHDLEVEYSDKFTRLQQSK